MITLHWIIYLLLFQVTFCQRSNRQYQPHTRACNNEQFRCNDGKCIELFRRCDFIQDCTNNEDELNCSPCLEGSEFQCDDGTCKPIDLKCDGVADCPDQSDEKDCPSSCEPDQFRCQSGLCLSSFSRCNGIPECPDNDDERGCFSCTSDQFSCRDNSQCIELSRKCDGNPDCRDRSDEENCESRSCPPESFTCISDGHCVDQQRRCDGVRDCIDRSDEENCPTGGQGRACSPESYTCRSNNQCIEQERRCDGRPDCIDKSDEENCPGSGGQPFNCPPDLFPCYSSGTCISLNSRCNGIPECRDGEDEQGCSSCAANEFRCENDQCVPQAKVCDGLDDCFDASDERNCEKQQCTETQFRCGDGVCIDKAWKCDTISDCGDGSDEIGCSCNANEFQCGSGECIVESLACDGRNDCRDDSDETSCPCRQDEFSCRRGGCVPQSSVCDNNNDCADGSDEDESLCTRCASYEFECSSGECIFITQRCNGQPECADRSDELGCPGFTTCESYEFKCRSGECIPRQIICDGRFDCLDRSDEENCPGTTKRPCNQLEFTCSDGSCIDIYTKCDGRADCRDGSDELNCDSRGCLDTEFQCTDGECISQRARCDNRIDCFDGSDEADCPGSSACSSGQFACRENSQCIELTRKCDGRPDCRDRSDEENCQRICLPNQFKCISGECVDESLRCNNRYDCSDGTDEYGCTSRTTTTPKPRCGIYEYQCRDGRQCVDASKRCDRRFDCLDRSDEENCPDEPIVGECRPDQYACASGECISVELRCNNIYDCPDGTDEYGCIRTSPTTTTTTTERPRSRICRLDEFRCNDGQCVPVSSRCNNNNECADGSDELDCQSDSSTCQSYEFMCSDRSQCIDSRRKCDGYFDCFDRSDETNCIRTCREYEFTCSSGDCIPTYLVCNDNYDCPDGSDEQNCAGALCDSQSEFACRDGRQCIALSGRCNQRPECFDKSDEENCPSEVFRCNSGENIPLSLQCDNRPDCIDGSDEFRCGGQIPSETVNLVTLPTNQTIEQGREVVFRCRDEGNTRAPVRWVRQGHSSLPPKSTDVRGRLTIEDVQLSASGDYYCEAQGVASNTPGIRKKVTLNVIPFVKPTVSPGAGACAFHETTCRKYGQCIPKSSVCDGRPDCRDGSDEDRCNLVGCEPNEFQCDNKRCIQKSWLCDSDDDCMDGSDEGNCRPKLPGELCEVFEFECNANLSHNQCIPRSFVCDNEMDCFDQSDETGCSKPIIVEAPIREKTVERGQTFTLTCRAVGMPVPEIVWRLNWGHVPETCSFTSEGGYGVLTCVNVQINHQGAYSCEAINTIGPTFAVPDAIVSVKTPGGTGQCVPPQFNEAAVSAADCLQCYCFGVTDQCSSTDQFISQIQINQPAGDVGIIGVNHNQYEGIFVIRENDYPISSQYVRTSNVKTFSIYIPDRAVLGGPQDLLLYYSLPSIFKGNQIKSYGGHLRYQFSYIMSGSRQPVLGPDIIIRGNNVTLMYVIDAPLSDNHDYSMEIRIWPGKWYKRISSNGGRIQRIDPAARTDIMTVLQNIDLILIRASYSDGPSLQATLSDVQLDSASYNVPSQARAVYVESCICPTGYTGLSCEECAANYRRIYDGSPLGRCVLDETCGPSEFGDPANGIPCQLCPCPLTNPANQFSSTCYLDADGQVTCNCRTGYSGRRCESCSGGYSGNPTIPGQDCKPSGECDPYGSYSSQPDPITGLCQCKEYATGPKCSQCQTSTFYLNENSRQGCIRCFCMGVSNNCSSSNWYRTQEIVGFVGGPSQTQGFELVNQFQDTSLKLNLLVDNSRQELVYRDSAQLSDNVYYWKVPRKFVSDKVTAYGGNLTYTVRYLPARGGRLSKNTAYDVQIYGNDVTMRYFNRNQPLEANTLNTLTVPLFEQYWERQDGQEANREHFLMALADLEYILIKATYTTNTEEIGLKEVFLDYATPRNTGQQRAFAVESCDCPTGYKGLSCEDCAPGYTRELSALYLGECKPCDCRGHSEECDPDTGVCFNCRDNRAGDFCEKCAPGFYENFLGECQREDQSRGCSCDPKGSLSTECENNRCRCKPTVEGDECKTCKAGYFYLSESNTDGCLPCWCNGVTDKCTSSYKTREQIPMNLFDDHNFTITTSERDNVFREIEVNLAENKLTFSDVQDISQLFWSLPQIFTGNKLSSYGGYLSLTQSYDESRQSFKTPEEDIIIIGANQKKVFWKNNGTTSGPFSIKVQLVENNFESTNPVFGTVEDVAREDFLSILANVEAILVRASLTNTITSTSLQDVVLDTAVDYNSGQSRALEVEQCTCPSNYIGNSCEDCAQGYYKDQFNRCLRCQCNGKEETCSLDEENRIVCNCLPGYSGQNCEISGFPGSTGPVAVFEVLIPQNQYETAAGSTVTLQCRVYPSRQGQMTIAWDKVNGTLPIRRAYDNRQGLLEISQVRPEDTGTYICRASTGIRVEEQTTYLRVTGGPPPSRPIVVIDETREELYIRIGEFARIRCRAQGSPPPQVQWYRQDGRALSLSVSESNGILTLNNPQRSDSGTYVCLGRNVEGAAQATITIHVEKDTEVVSPENIIIVRVPENVQVQAGSFVRIECSVPVSEVSSYKWSRMRYPLPTEAVQTDGQLVIPNAKPADSGMYTCTVTDVRGRIGKATTDVLIVAYGTPPEVRIEPDRQTIHQGTTAELRCITSAEPKPTITWTKENEQLSQNARPDNDILRIVNAEVSDRGLYRCSATNSNGQGSAVAVLEVELREPPVIEMYPDNRLRIRKGESASFLCHLTKGYPVPSISWERTDGKQVTSNTNILPGGVIKFHQVTGEEEGTYMCSASNDAGKMTAVATLDVEAVPVVTLRPPSRSLTIKAGNRLRLECSADGDPVPTLSWQKLQANFPQDIPTKSITPRVIIYEVASASRADQAVYQCIATNSAGTTIERVQVIIEEDFLPGYSGHPDNRLPGQTELPGPSSDNNKQFQVPLGGQFQFRCVIEGLTGDTQLYTYEFRRSDGRPLPRESLLGPRTLTVSNVERSAQGEYACIISERSSAQAIITIYATLQVIDPPRITLEPARQVVRPGDNANLRCSVTGDQPITITWSKQQSQSLPPTVIINGGMLMFRGIQITDAGKYLCEAVNPVGRAEAVAEVVVNDKPLLTSLQQRVTLSEGQDGELRCTPSGLPPSSVRWVREGSSIPPNFRAAGNVLRIYQPKIADSGQYKCEARTSSGYYTYDYVDLLVQRHTGTVVNIQASSEDVRMGDSVELFCEANTVNPSQYYDWSMAQGGSLPNNAEARGNRLIIDNADQNNSGVYVCSVVSNSGTFRSEYLLDVRNILSAERSVETRSVQTGSRVLIQCGANASPSSDYSWKKQGGRLPNRARVRQDTLEIPQVHAEDAGTYVCTASNAQQNEQSPTLLLVTGVIPRFNGDSHLAYPTLRDAYLFFDLEISFKPDSPDGLILYNGQRESHGDFISFGLRNGLAEFKFDVGSGPAILTSESPLAMGEWHTVKLTRNRKEGTMTIVGEGPPITGKSIGRFQGLDLIQPLYLGGVEDFSTINVQSGFTTGFTGCISQLIVGIVNTQLLRDSSSQKGISSCATCTETTCENGGVCQESFSPKGFKCMCPSGYSGEICQSTGETCYPGLCGTGRCLEESNGYKCLCPYGTAGTKCEKRVDISTPSISNNSFLAYRTPRALKRFSVGMRIKPKTLDDGLIMYSAQHDSGDGDFISLALNRNRIELRFNTGSRTAIIKSGIVSPGNWIKIVANRTDQLGSLKINNEEMRHGEASGNSRSLNLRTPLYFGSVDTTQIEISPEVGIKNGFAGCLSDLEIMEQPVFDNGIVDSSDISECEDACRTNFCENGGTCIKTDFTEEGFACYCQPGFAGDNCEIASNHCASDTCANGGICKDRVTTFECYCPLGFSGTLCEQNAYISDSAAFSGNSWLEMDKYLLSQDGIGEQILEMEFSTTSPNGILFWMGQEPNVYGSDKDFLSLAVNNGRLEMSFGMGGEVYKESSRINVDDGKYHTIIARKTGRTADFELLNEDPLLFIEGKEDSFSFNTNGNIYLGGTPNILLMTGTRKNGFDGCLHRVKLGDTEIDNFMNLAISGENVEPCQRNEESKKRSDNKKI